MCPHTQQTHQKAVYSDSLTHIQAFKTFYCYLFYLKCQHLYTNPSICIPISIPNSPLNVNTHLLTFPHIFLKSIIIVSRDMSNPLQIPNSASCHFMSILRKIRKGRRPLIMLGFQNKQKMLVKSWWQLGKGSNSVAAFVFRINYGIIDPLKFNLVSSEISKW